MNNRSDAMIYNIEKKTEVYGAIHFRAVVEERLLSYVIRQVSVIAIAYERLLNGFMHAFYIYCICFNRQFQLYSQ